MSCLSEDIRRECAPALIRDRFHNPQPGDRHCVALPASGGNGDEHEGADEDLHVNTPCPRCGAGETVVRVQRLWSGTKRGSVVTVSIHHWCTKLPGTVHVHTEIRGRSWVEAQAQWNMRPGLESLLNVGKFPPLPSMAKIPLNEDSLRAAHDSGMDAMEQGAEPRDQLVASLLTYTGTAHEQDLNKEAVDVALTCASRVFDGGGEDHEQLEAAVRGYLWRLRWPANRN